MKGVTMVCGGGDNCVLISQQDSTEPQYAVTLCNAIGSPIDSRYIDFTPAHIAMNNNLIVIASATVVYVWLYTNAQPDSTQKSAKRDQRVSPSHADDDTTFIYYLLRVFDDVFVFISRSCKILS
jgi:WD repeat-containing protein 35